MGSAVRVTDRAWHYSKRTKHKVRRINAVLQHPDPELPWMLANIDHEVIGADDVQILECKTAGINAARLWKEGVPECVQLQVMDQFAVTGRVPCSMTDGYDCYQNGLADRVNGILKNELLRICSRPERWSARPSGSTTRSDRIWLCNTKRPMRCTGRSRYRKSS